MIHAMPVAETRADTKPRDAAATLAAWTAREAELASVWSGPGIATPEQVQGKHGVQIFEAMFRGEIPRPPISATLNFVIVEAAAGHAEFQGTPLFAHYNPLGTVHGGWIATLLDSAVGCAIHTLVPPGKTYTTLELKVNFVRAVTTKVPLVRAVGQVIHLGGKIGTAEGRLVGPDGTLYAHATTTCLIMDPR